MGNRLESGLKEFIGGSKRLRGKCDGELDDGKKTFSVK